MYEQVTGLSGNQGTRYYGAQYPYSIIFVLLLGKIMMLFSMKKICLLTKFNFEILAISSQGN